jgi:sensor c-di-GMP phosphodiesterase-like protein
MFQNNFREKMQTQIPIGIIISLFALSTFYYYNKKSKLRKEEQRDRLFEARQNYLWEMLKNGNEDQSN